MLSQRNIADDFRRRSSHDVHVGDQGRRQRTPTKEFGQFFARLTRKIDVVHSCRRAEQRILCVKDVQLGFVMGCEPSRHPHGHTGGLGEVRRSQHVPGAKHDQPPVNGTVALGAPMRTGPLTVRRSEICLR
jgi:hypothetical protein